MHDFYYRLEPGERPTMADHLDVLNIYCKSPINMALEILCETINLTRYDNFEKARLNDCLNTIQAALVTWEQIDNAMMRDS